MRQAALLPLAVLAGIAAPQQVRDAPYAAATKGVIKSAKSANAHLLFTSY
ncbi:MAG: hypothetical protein H0V92_01925 [Pseudonocardiales bacterium]|nr:hypothetical protein [Pseudonocardiales bacterium]